jgi:threonine/homoserine/homoserine lactone efflux protein
MFIKGFILGFSIAAIVGPIALLCIRRTLAMGRLSGFVSGLGAACAGAVYASIAALGLTAVSGLLLNYQHILQLVGGLFLCYLGVKTFVSKPAEVAQGLIRVNLMSDFVTTFFLAITNPLTILLYLSFFAGLGFEPTSGSYLAGLLLVLGAFLGSTTWWLILSFIVGFFRTSLTRAGIVIINKIAGCMILGFGCWALFGFLQKVLLSR